MRLSATDRVILESYKSLVSGLAHYLGEGYEFVLHSLENMDKSVIKIVNGHHTGRKEGAPITDLALEMLEKIQKNKENEALLYFTHNKKGEPLKSSTIPIYGEGGRIIGLLCINFYLNTPLSSLLGNYGVNQASASDKFANENFAQSIGDLIHDTYEVVRKDVMSDAGIPPLLKNKEIVLRLDERGIFKIKDAIVTVAQLMGISKNTVYLHLRNIHKTEQ